MIKRAILALFLIALLGLAGIGCPDNDTMLPGDNGASNNSGDNNNGDNGDSDSDGESADDFEQSPVGTGVGNTAHDFSLFDTNGQVVSLKDLRGKAVILNFWQTTCPPCVEEMPLFQQIHQQYSNEGVVLLGIDIYETQTTVTEFMAEYNLTLTMLLDSQATVATSYDVLYTPTTFFIDAHGVIQAKKIGQFLSKAQIEQGIQMITP